MKGDFENISDKANIGLKENRSGIERFFGKVSGNTAIEVKREPEWD